MKYLLLLLIFCGCLDKTSPTSSSTDTLYISQGNYLDTMGILTEEDTLRFLGLKSNEVLDVVYYRRSTPENLWSKDADFTYDFELNAITRRGCKCTGWEFWVVFTLR